MTASAEGKGRIVTGLFLDAQSAERAYHACVDRGYAIGEVNVVVSEDRRKQLFPRAARSGRCWSRKAEASSVGPRGVGSASWSRYLPRSAPHWRCPL
jgi:hypothetical protein